MKQKIIDLVLKEASAILLKTAFPQLLTKLKSETRDSIARMYSIGPKSKQEEIPIAYVTKKPYNESLLIYTINIVTDEERYAKDREIRDEMDKFYKTEQFVELRGSAAGKKMEDAKRKEVDEIISAKYKPTEKIVAWGVGTQFQSNWDIRRRRDFSNRKQLIDYVMGNNGKVYYISPDPDVASARAKRRTPSEPENVTQLRAKKLFEAKIPALKAKLVKWHNEFKAKAAENMEKYLKTVEEGKPDASLMKAGLDINWEHPYNKIKSALQSGYSDLYYAYGSGTDAQKLQDFVKKLNGLLAA